MNTNALIGLVALVVVVGGGVWFFSSKKDMQDGSAEAHRSSQDAVRGEGTFAELMARTGSWKCDVAVAIEEAPSQGEVYISDGKIHADFTAQIEAMGGQSVRTQMIQTDGYVYTWSDMTPQGFKMPIPEGGEADAPQGVSYDSRVSYDCAPWTLDMSLFIPPSNVTFMEIGAELPEGKQLPQY